MSKEILRLKEAWRNEGKTAELEPCLDKAGTEDTLNRRNDYRANRNPNVN